MRIDLPGRNLHLEIDRQRKSADPGLDVSVLLCSDPHLHQSLPWNMHDRI